MIDKKGYPITIQQKTVTTGNGFTGNTVTWATFATVKGIINAIKGNESMSANKNTVNSTHKLFLYPLENLTTDHRVFYNDEYYDIDFIDDPMNFSEFYKVFLKASDNYVSASN